MTNDRVVRGEAAKMMKMTMLKNMMMFMMIMMLMTTMMMMNDRVVRGEVVGWCGCLQRL